MTKRLVLHRLPDLRFISAIFLSVLIGIVRLDAVMAAAQHPDKFEWSTIHGNIANQRYVPLSQINRETVARLGAEWVSDPFPQSGTSRMTPLVHEGLMLLAAGSHILALNAQTGEVVWDHATETRSPEGTDQFKGDPSAALQASGLAITRAFGLGMGGGMVFAGLMNGHILALREKTGELVWDRLVSDAPLAIARGIVNTPLYLNGVLYVGYGHEFVRGHTVALEASTGRVLWQLGMTPAPGEPGHDSWPSDNDTWRLGDSEPWAAAAADPSLGLLYLVTANAGPPSGGSIRKGNNLYSVSLLAVQIRSGKIRWFRQLIHHDVWEADLSVPPVLFEQKVAGRTRRGVGVIRGDGYLFLFDRVTGEPLVPIDERPVPQNPQVFTAATQPFPRGGVSILGPCERWRSRIPRGFALGCMFDPPSRDVPNRLSQFASVRIAPMSYDPQTEYFYAQGTNSLMWMGTGEDPYVWVTNINGARVPGFPPITSVVAAIDSHDGRIVWQKELPSYDHSGYKSNGGSLTTAGGLVFHQGGDGTLQAYDARTGDTLWHFQMDFALGDASPMSYAIHGKQYVAVVAGSKVWAFCLHGPLPPASPIPAPPHEAVSGPIEDKNEIETLTLEPAFGHGRRYHLNEYMFNPYRTRIRTGETVKFINNGYQSHTIIAQDGSWSTRTLVPTEVASLTFDEPGHYLYSSKEYPWSFGEIIVVPRSAAGSGASEQIEDGKKAYVESCASCHGANLAGQDRTPELAGYAFTGRWSDKSALDLYDRIRTTMPLNAPHSLDNDTYAAIVSYILSSNGATLAQPVSDATLKELQISGSANAP